MSRLYAFGLSEDGDGGGGGSGEGGGASSTISAHEPHIPEPRGPSENAERSTPEERASRIADRIDARSRTSDDLGSGGASRNEAQPRPQGDEHRSNSDRKYEFSLSAGNSGFAQFLMFPAVGYQAMAGARTGGSLEAYGGGFVGAGGFGLAFFLPGATVSVGWGTKAEKAFSAACQPAVVVSIAIFQITATALPSSPELELDSVSLSASEGLGLGVVGGVYCGAAVRDLPSVPDQRTAERYFIQRK